MPLSARSVAVPPSKSTTTQRGRGLGNKSYHRMMTTAGSTYGDGQGEELNNDGTAGGNGVEKGGHILTPQVPRIVPRFMGGKHIRGLGQGYQRRFTPKTFYLPGEEPPPPQSQPQSPGKSKHDDDDDSEGEGEKEGVPVVMTDVDPLEDPADEAEVPLAPIWERPTRYSCTASITQTLHSQSIQTLQSSCTLLIIIHPFNHHT